MDIVHLGKRLRQIRNQRDLPATRLDELAEIGRGTVHRVEEGLRPEVSMSVVSRIARALNVRLDYLMWGDAEDTAGRPVDDLEMQVLTFLYQIQRIPGLLRWIEDSGGKTPIYVIARGLRELRDNPPELKKDGSPPGGWDDFFRGVWKSHVAPTDGKVSANGKAVALHPDKPRRRRR